jgi:hypothetical protein
MGINLKGFLVWPQDLLKLDASWGKLRRKAFRNDE